MKRFDWVWVKLRNGRFKQGKLMSFSSRVNPEYYDVKIKTNNNYATLACDPKNVFSGKRDVRTLELIYGD